jgi:hypothetical protein
MDPSNDPLRITPGGHKILPYRFPYGKLNGDKICNAAVL